MFKINLIPEVKQEQQRLRKLNLTFTTIAIGTAIAVGVSTVLMLGYIVAVKTQISSIEKDTQKITQELKKYEDLENTVLNLENGLTQIKKILNSGSKWSTFFVELEKVVPQDIQISSLKVKEGEIDMDLRGKNVKSIDRFVKSFSSFEVKDTKIFTDVRVSGYNDESGSVRFSAKMNFSSGVLW